MGGRKSKGTSRSGSDTKLRLRFISLIAGAVNFVFALAFVTVVSVGVTVSATATEQENDSNSKEYDYFVSVAHDDDPGVDDIGKVSLDVRYHLGAGKHGSTGETKAIYLGHRVRKRKGAGGSASGDVSVNDKEPVAIKFLAPEDMDVTIHRTKFFVKFQD